MPEQKGDSRKEHNSHDEEYKSPFDAPGIKEAVNEEWAAKRRLANATRELITATVTTTASLETLTQAAESIEAQVRLLQEAPCLKGRTEFEKREGGRFLSMGSLGYELNPLDGQSNPIASSFDIWFEDDRVHGKVKMGWPYEGPPNSVHGGMVAALFDQFLGVGQKLTGQPGFTGTLSVRYIKPTPIGAELRLEGWVDSVEGRKNILKGEMWANGVLTASCEGIFISVTAEHIAALKAGQ